MTASHVHFDLSWDTVAEQLLYDDDQLPIKEGSQVNQKKLDQLVNLIQNHPHRFLFGSDSLSPNAVSNWQQTEKTYEKLFLLLDDHSYNSIRIENYERLIIGARRKVRLWEKHCMPYAAIGILRRSDYDRPDYVIQALTNAIQDAIKHGEENIALELSNRSDHTSMFSISSQFLKKAATAVIANNKAPWDGNAEFDRYLENARRMSQ